MPLIDALERCTADDLALWEAQHDCDRMGEVEEKKVLVSIAELQRFAQDGECYVSTSWGKDSVVVLHLVAMANLQLPVVNLRISPSRNPYCDAVRDAFLLRYPLEYHEIEVSYNGCGVWFSDEWELETYRLWNAAWRDVEKRFGRKHISGVRSDESGGRKIRMRTHGMSSRNASAPIGWWKNHEVFCYLARHDLPIHPNYAMNGGGRYERKNLRVAEIGDLKGTQFGRREWEQEYYGDVLNRMLMQSAPTPKNNSHFS